MKKSERFGLLPAAMIQILSVGLVNHVLIVPLILHLAKRDSWMCPIFALAFGILWVSFPIYGTMKRLKEPLVAALERITGKFGAWLFKIPLCLVLFSVALNTMVDTTSWAKTTYLPQTPTLVITAATALIVIYAASSGIRTIAFASAVLLPFVIMLGDFVLTANMPHKDYSYLRPVLEHGWGPIWQGSLLSACSLTEMYGLVLYGHYLKRRFKWYHLLILAVMLSLLTIGPVTGAVTQFGPAEAERMRYPAFSQWRLVQIGKYVEHLDFFAIYQWISGATVRMGLSLFLITDMLGLRNGAKKAWTHLILFLLLVPIAEVMSGHMVMYRQLSRYFFPATGGAVAVVGTAAWLAVLVGERMRRRGNDAGVMSAEGGGAS